MKNSLSLFLLTLYLTTSISHADDYVWGEEFKEGDIISAETFNQIFSTLQKLNRTPIDADLLGTWNCDAVHSQSGLDTTGWTANDFLLILDNAQITMTASSQSTSLAQSYSYSTSNPSPFIRFGINAASSGTYILFNDMLLMKGVMSASAIAKYQVNIISDDRFILTPLSDGGNYPDLIMCDSANGVPTLPTNAAATNAQTLVNVTWTDNSADETGFKIYRRLSNETEAKEIATAVTASLYSDSTLTEGQTAYYSVAAYNDNGESPKTKVVTATLDSVKPTISSHTPTNNQQMSGASVSLSITFSENVYVMDASGIDISGTKCSYSNFPPSDSVAVLAPSIDLNTLMCSGDTVTVLINKDGIQDMNGNNLDQDYTFTFTIQ